MGIFAFVFHQKEGGCWVEGCLTRAGGVRACGGREVKGGERGWFGLRAWKGKGGGG